MGGALWCHKDSDDHEISVILQTSTRYRPTSLLKGVMRRYYHRKQHYKVPLDLLNPITTQVYSKLKPFNVKQS